MANTDSHVIISPYTVSHTSNLCENKHCVAFKNSVKLGSQTTYDKMKVYCINKP